MSSKAKQVQAINKQIGQIKENTRKKLRVLQAKIAQNKEQLPKASVEQKKRLQASLTNLRHSVRKLRTARDSAILTLQNRKEQIYSKASLMENTQMKIKDEVIASLMETAAGRTQEWFDKLKPAEQRKYLKENPNSKFSQKKASPVRGAQPLLKTSKTKPLPEITDPGAIKRMQDNIQKFSKLGLDKRLGVRFDGSLSRAVVTKDQVKLINSKLEKDGWSRVNADPQSAFRVYRNENGDEVSTAQTSEYGPMVSFTAMANRQSPRPKGSSSR